MDISVHETLPFCLLLRGLQILHRRPRHQHSFLESDSSSYQISGSLGREKKLKNLVLHNAATSVSSLNFIRRKWLQRSPCSSNLKFNTQRNCRSINVNSKCHHIPSASIQPPPPFLKTQKNLVYVKQTKKGDCILHACL